MPFQCICTPNSRIGVQSLHINGDREVGRQSVVVLAERENLGMSARGFGDKDYGAVKAKRLKLRTSAKTIPEEDTRSSQRTIIARHLRSLGNAAS